MCGVHIHEFGMFHEIFIQTVIELKLQLDCALWGTDGVRWIGKWIF